MAAFYPDIIPTPFASKGDKNQIRASQRTSGDGSAAWDIGFGTELSGKLPPNGQGKPVNRLDFNGIFYALSSVAYYAQSGGIFQYNKSLNYYANKALIFHKGQLYICVKDVLASATVEPGTDSTRWMPLLTFLQSDSSNVGNVVYRASTSLKNNQLLCNGAAYSRTKYAALFEDIGTTWGAGDGKTTFNVPDLRGVVIRGLDMGRGLDPNRQLGTYQADAVQKATGSIGIFNNYAAMLGKPTGPFYTEVYGPQIGIKSTSSTDSWVEIKYDLSKQSRTAEETRMKNVALVPVIFYK